MPNTENLNLLPDYFGSADQAVLALAASVDTNPDSMLGGFIVFSRGFEHYRISRPASIEGYPWVEFNEQGVLALDPDLDFCGTYCTTDTAGAREIADAHGEQGKRDDAATRDGDRPENAAGGEQLLASAPLVFRCHVDGDGRRRSGSFET